MVCVCVCAHNSSHLSFRATLGNRGKQSEDVRSKPTVGKGDALGTAARQSRPEDSLPPSMVPNPRSQSMLRAELKEQVREKRDRNESLRSFTMLKTRLDHRLRENSPLKSPQNLTKKQTFDKLELSKPNEASWPLTTLKLQ